MDHIISQAKPPEMQFVEEPEMARSRMPRRTAPLNRVTIMLDPGPLAMPSDSVE